MEKRMRLLPPTMPNFIHLDRPAGKRQDGFQAKDFTISISELSAAEAEEYGELMKQEFIKHWREACKDE